MRRGARRCSRRWRPWAPCCRHTSSRTSIWSRRWTPSFTPPSHEALLALLSEKAESLRLHVRSDSPVELRLLAKRMTDSLLDGEREAAAGLLGWSSRHEYYDFLRYAYWAFTSLVVRVLAPVLIIWFVLRQRPADFGFRIRGVTPHVKVYLIFFLGMIPILYAASLTTALYMGVLRPKKSTSIAPLPLGRMSKVIITAPPPRRNLSDFFRTVAGGWSGMFV